MSTEKTKDELSVHMNNAVSTIQGFVQDLIDSEDSDIRSKADKFCYWMESYIKYLKYEPTFSPTSLKRYKRGEIIKVNLGYNVGSEEGGLHYAVVIDKNNPYHSPVLTIVPLTSLKPTTNLNRLPSTSIYLGNELFTNLSAQIQLTRQHLSKEINRIQHLIKPDAPIDNEVIKNLEADLKKAKKENTLLDKMNREIGKMKKGSIALVNQVTTISKIRIYDPRTNHDILSHVRLSSQKLDLIDSAIISHYTGRQ